MKILTCERGDTEWLKHHLGIPTCSRFDDLLTPKTLKPSGGRERYRGELMAEWLLGQPLEWGSNAWTERGTEMEDEARAWYEMAHDVEVVAHQLVLRDDGLVGGSPDGLIVGARRGVEIKVLGAGKHVLAMLDGGAKLIEEHRGQVQGYLHLTEYERWDLLSYHPDLPPVVVAVFPDPEYQGALAPVLDDFVAVLESDKRRLAQYKMERPWTMSLET